MAYQKQTWEDLPSTSTPLNSNRLNHMEDGIFDADKKGNEIGTITMYAGQNAPTGYMLCDGSDISRSTYSALFEVIGTTYGEGNGTTTFNIPNLKGKVPVGLDINDTDFDTLGETGGEKKHTLTIQEMPSHNHNFNVSMQRYGNGSNTSHGTMYNNSMGNSLEIANTGGGQAHNVLQPYVVLNYIIRVS